MRKPIQLITTGKGALVALCNDGAMFRMGAEGWVDLPAVPQPEKKSRSTNKSTKTDDYSLVFEDFWSIYPRKTAKKEAYKSWLKVEQWGLKIIDSLKRQVAGGMWKEQKFIPHASTYLNQHRWEDEVVQVDEQGEVKHWTDTWSGICRKGAELGIEQGDMQDYQYKAVVLERAGKSALRSIQGGLKP